MLIPLEGNLFDTIAGVPVHALVVPVAAVLLPLGALALLVEVLFPKLANRLGWFTIIILALGAGASWVAGESGQALATHVAEPQPHATLGRVLPFVAIALAIIAVIWLILQQRALKTLGHRSSASAAFGVVAAILALAVAFSAAYIAYLGIQASWVTRLAPPVAATPAPVPSPSPATPSETPITTPNGYSLADVAQHSDSTSCWVVVADQVYDITPWLSDTSPRRAEVLTTCGGNASTLFDNSATAPMLDAELAVYLIGPLR